MDLVDIDLEQSARVIRFTTEAPLPLELIRQRLYAVGYGVRGASCFNTVTGATSESGVPPFPEFEDTGEELIDHSRYESAKEAWITNHPEAYQRMMHPSPVSHAHR